MINSRHDSYVLNSVANWIVHTYVALESVSWKVSKT